MFLVGAISRTFAGFTQWRTLAGTLLRGVFAQESNINIVMSRCFAFHTLITQVRIWKSFRVEDSNNYTSFTHSLINWNLENLYKTWCIKFFFCLSWHFKRENSLFWKASFFAEQELITGARLCAQDFMMGKNFSFNQRHNKEFCNFSWESKCIIKAIGNFFPEFRGS